MTTVVVVDYSEELIANAKAIATPGKGILAADESTGTIQKRFAEIGVENTKENRVAYRHLLFTTEGIEKYISGVITYDETFWDNGPDGAPLISHLKAKGILVGIKVDKGVQPLYGCDDESTTQGFDDLEKTCKKYYAAGARFAKWRAVLRIGAHEPSQLSIEENTRGLARYAAICQAAGLVPIVEPEILSDGTHTIQECAKVARAVITAQYKALADHNVLLEGTLFKPAMVTPGSKSGQVCSAGDIATATIRTFLRCVPAAVPGITFLSGGQSEEDASLNLNAMNTLALPRPWNVSFSYGRALQATVLRTWAGKADNVAAAQAALLERCKANGEASLGTYAGSNDEALRKSLFVSSYKY